MPTTAASSTSVARRMLGWTGVAIGVCLPLEVVGPMSGSRSQFVHASLLLVVAATALVLTVASDGIRTLARTRARLSCPTILVLGLLAALVVIHAGFAVGREGLTGPLRYLVVQLVVLACLAVVATCQELHLRVLVGYLIGVTISAAVSVTQAVGLVDPPWPMSADRFPGLAATTPQLSWQLAIAAVIGIHLVRSERGTARAAAVAAVSLCLAALATCGSQGGILGLAVAAAVVLVHNARRHAVAREELLRLGGVLIGLLVLALLALALLGVSPRSVVGLTGDADKGYENELARVDGLSSGLRALVESPLTGPGVDAYTAEGHVMPHVVPIALGISTGLLGIVLGGAVLASMAIFVVRGPRRGAPLGWIAQGILGVFLVKSLVTTNGPLSDLADRLLLVLAVVAWSGRVQGGPADRTWSLASRTPRVAH